MSKDLCHCGHPHSYCSCHHSSHHHNHQALCKHHHSHSHYGLHFNHFSHRLIHDLNKHHHFNHHSSHHHLNHHCGHHHHSGNHHCSCHSHHIVDRYLCDNDFRVRLGGLQRGMAFRLRQLLDHDIKLVVECGESEENLDAKLCFVGSDFIEVRVQQPKKKQKKPNRCKPKQNKKHKKEAFRLIPFDQIKWIGVKEHDCC